MISRATQTRHTHQFHFTLNQHTLFRSEETQWDDYWALLAA